MSEENLPGSEPIDHTDSNRRIVSRNLDTFSDERVQITTNNGLLKKANIPINLPTISDIESSLSSALDKMKLAKNTMNDVQKMTDHFVNICQTDLIVLPLLNTATPTLRDADVIHIAHVSSDLLNTTAGRKRKRESPEETRLRIRQKLQVFAYTGANKGIKNVSFCPQVDTTAAHRVSSMGSITSEEDTVTRDPTPGTSMSNPQPPPRAPPALVVTQEEIRGYQVKDRYLHIWKLLEAQLREVGRHDAQVSQLTEELDQNTPPSWCFEGSTAPLYLRPFNDILINITQAYANTMAAAARQIIYTQAQVDQREANQLLETLRRMYEEDNDPDFELAHQRALGIASHYKTKEQQLNKRLHQADAVNQPQTRNEWADTLGRRKVSRPSRRRPSQSRSPIRGHRYDPNTNRGNLW